MTKKLSKWIAMLLSLAMLVTMAAACGDDKPSGTPALTGIEITSQPTKQKYVEGDTFNTSGMVVSAVFENGDKTAVTDYTYSPSGSLAIGTTEVVITYKDKTAAVAISVAERAISSIEVTNPPAKTEYVEGEIFDKKGMKVVANYNDGTSMEITDYNVVPAGALTSDVTKVTLSYLGKTAEVEITVTQKTVTKLEITSEPSVKQYVEGQSFSTAGMVVKAAFSDGTSSPVIGYTVTPSGALSLGTTQVEIAFGGKTVTQDITVIAKAVSSIEITKNPTKTIYFDGETFDKTGMEVTAVYNDGERKVVTDYNVDKTVLTLNDTSVTVTYEGKTAVCEIAVSKAIESIRVSKQPSVTEYVEGQKFNPEGMEITADYSDSTSGVITGWTVTNGGKALAIGDTFVEIEYAGKTVNQPITVIAKAVASIEVTKQPTKVKYIVGQSLAADGLEVTAVYNDGDKKVVPEKKGESDGYVLTAPESLTAGSNTVTVQYAEKQTTFTVTARQVVSVTVTATDAFKSAYAEGETFDPAGLEMSAVLDDDDTITVAYDKTGKDGFTCDTEKQLTSADTAVILTFKGKSVSIDITVKGGFAVEAEKAILVSKSCESLRLYSDSPLASGGMYVGEVREGDKIRYEFTASKVGTASVYLRAASGDCKEWSSNGQWAPVVMNDVVIKDAVTIKVNGNEFTVPDTAILKGGKTDDKVNGDKSLWFNWAQVKLENIAVKEGINTFEITYVKGMNTDSIKVLFDGDLTGAPSMPNYTVSTVGGGQDGAPVYSSDTLTKHAFEFESINGSPDKWKNQTNNNASGSGFIDNIAGDYVGFNFKINLAEKDENAVIDLVGACANYVWNSETNSGGNVSLEDIGKYFQIRINGIQIDLTGLKLECRDGGDWNNWTSIVVSGVTLEQGENVIEVRRGTGYPNLDVLNVWTSVALAA